MANIYYKKQDVMDLAAKLGVTVIEANTQDGYAVMAQADPNGLFSPASAEGTWILMADPNNGGKTLPVYVEPRILVSPFKPPASMLDQ